MVAKLNERSYVQISLLPIYQKLPLEALSDPPARDCVEDIVIKCLLIPSLRVWMRWSLNAIQTRSSPS